MPVDTSQFKHTTTVVVTGVLYRFKGNTIAKNLSTDIAVNVNTLDVTAKTEEKVWNVLVFGHSN